MNGIETVLLNYGLAGVVILILYKLISNDLKELKNEIRELKIEIKQLTVVLRGAKA